MDYFMLHRKTGERKQITEEVYFATKNKTAFTNNWLFEAVTPAPSLKGMPIAELEAKMQEPEPVEPTPEPVEPKSRKATKPKE